MHIERYHVYAVLLQNINLELLNSKWTMFIGQLFLQSNITVSHTLKKGNRFANFMEKLGASFDDDLVLHDSSLADLFELLKSDTDDTFYLRE